MAAEEANIGQPPGTPASNLATRSPTLESLTSRLPHLRCLTGVLHQRHSLQLLRFEDLGFFSWSRVTFSPSYARESKFLFKDLSTSGAALLVT
ncbi:uncharacterized protein G2W53_014023 [Senna tora]|uniref:Uncharacterized protein n=1 Tax=Senna tora TaxID=362788 RepID=A0A834U013_9FABA|nr:uncharacterized protein G2W53_014023 [Senna tora]